MAGLKNPALRQAGRQYIESAAFRSCPRGSGQAGWVGVLRERNGKADSSRPSQKARRGWDDMRGRGEERRRDAGATKAPEKKRGSEEPCPAAGRPPVHRIDGLSKLPSRLGQAGWVGVLRERNGKADPSRPSQKARRGSG